MAVLAGYGEIVQFRIFTVKKKGSFMHVNSKKGSKESTGQILDGDLTGRHEEKVEVPSA